MKKKLCYKCNKEINNDSTFCPHCGLDLSKKEIKCSKCNKVNDIKSEYCDKCGTKLKPENNNWDFDSKIIPITFWICSILTTFLLTCPGFIKTINFFDLPLKEVIGFTLVIIGLSISLFFNKEDINLKKETDIIKSIKLSKVQIGFILVLAGIITLLSLGSKQYGTIYLPWVAIVFVSFAIMTGIIISKNHHKLSLIGQVTCLILSIISFILSGYFHNYGNELNASYEAQFDSFWEKGVSNPGNVYLEYSRYALIIGIVFLVILFIIRTQKRNDK